MQEPVGQEAQSMPSVTRMGTLKYAGPWGGTGEKGESLLINAELGVPAQVQNGRVHSSEDIAGCP